MGGARPCVANPSSISWRPRSCTGAPGTSRVLHPEAGELGLLDRRFADCEPTPALVLALGRLVYQHFGDMNRYVTRFGVQNG